MDKIYADTVRVLLRSAPDVFANDCFALKGGTAINLFVQAMPRLSVDIDVTYTPWDTSRSEALPAIAAELNAVASRLRKIGLSTRKIAASKEVSESKLIVEFEGIQVKVEVNTVFRGTVLPTVRRALHPATQKQFGMEIEVPMLKVDELYGSKFVAALDRQHPRDLFDVWQLLRSGKITDAMVETFVVYLAGHNRPMHEVLFGRDKDVAREFRESFAGMTAEPVPLLSLVEARAALRAELSRRLTPPQKQFLIGLSRATPEWSLLGIPHAASLPALQWKLANVERFRRLRPGDFERQAEELQEKLG
jgi:predicted nucleotidyltransferase component of viral defense system